MPRGALADPPPSFVVFVCVWVPAPTRKRVGLIPGRPSRGTAANRPVLAAKNPMPIFPGLPERCCRVLFADDFFSGPNAIEQCFGPLHEFQVTAAKNGKNGPRCPWWPGASNDCEFSTGGRRLGKQSTRRPPNGKIEKIN